MTTFFVDRDRAFVRVHGREPVKMVQGLVTNDVAGAPADQGVYALVLSPKGKIMAELRVFRQDGEVLLEMDARALDSALATFRKFVPPLFAKFDVVTHTLRAVGVFGSSAREVVTGVLGAAPDAAAPEDAFITVHHDGARILCVRTLFAGDEGFDLFIPAEAAPGLRAALLAAGAGHGDLARLDVLRIEAGRPAWGSELDESVIPLEAGLRARAISETKGCYTGQEVIVRILHRGHVNRHLRGVLLGTAPVPARGAELHRAEDGKLVGTITSACVSPRFGQVIALAYVRREIEPPATLRLGSYSGPEARVVALPFDS
jgi:folate-binding protein YgfZ